MGEEDYLTDAGIDWRILNKLDGGMEWIDLAQDRDK
jgi:hypothetical protein